MKNSGDGSGRKAKSPKRLLDSSWQTDHSLASHLFTGSRLLSCCALFCAICPGRRNQVSRTVLIYLPTLIGN